MSAESSAEDRDDAAFRARLAPLASEVLSGQALTRASGPRLVVRGGTVTDVLPTSPPVPASKTTSGRKAWWIVAGCGAVIGLAVAGWFAFGMRPRPAADPVAARPVPPSAALTPPSPAVALPQATLPRPASSEAASAQSRSQRPPPGPTPEDEAMVTLLSRRGDAALAQGDIIAARLLFERAAGLGSAAAATKAGETYDIEFLLRSGATGIPADPAAATAWYRKAAALGDAEASARLARITAGARR